MTDQPSSFKKLRKLPGQDDLSADQWAELANEHYREEVGEECAAIDRKRRSAELNLPDNLKALRLRLGLRQAEMADRLEVALRSLQMYETGERAPTADFLSALYVRFGIDMHQLFTSAPREPSPGWKVAFSTLTQNVARQVAEAYPDLTAKEAKELVNLYMSRSEGEDKVDGLGLMLCYDALFRPDEC